MRLIAVTGFLGSGKTSLVLSLARVCARRGLRLAVIENEAGERDVDGQLLAASGLVVRQLAAGCICCTLEGDLGPAVASLAAAHSPDLLVIEASGIAAPLALAEALARIPGGPPAEILGLVDPTRCGLLDHLDGGSLSDLMEVAHLVAVSKADVAPPAAANLARRLREAAPTVPVLPIDTRDGTAVEDLLDLLAGQAPEAPPAARTAGAGPRLTAATASRCLVRSWDPPIAGSELIARVEGCLLRLGSGLPRPEAGVPGHLKAFIDGAGAGAVCLSLTDLGRGCDHRGPGLGGPVGRATVTMVAIACGLPPDHLERLLAGALSGLNAPSSRPLSPPGDDQRRIPS